MADEDKLESKIVLVGESGVGKTSISSFFQSGTFNINEEPTSSASFISKTIDYSELNKIIKFYIWDTAGQEKYRALSRLFYKDTNAAILVYDITDIKSFKEIQNYWYKELKQYAPNASKLKY